MNQINTQIVQCSVNQVIIASWEAIAALVMMVLDADVASSLPTHHYLQPQEKERYSG